MLLSLPEMVYPASQVQWVVPWTMVQRDGRTKGPAVSAGSGAAVAEEFVMVTKTEWGSLKKVRGKQWCHWPAIISSGLWSCIYLGCHQLSFIQTLICSRKSRAILNKQVCLYDGPPKGLSLVMVVTRWIMGCQRDLVKPIQAVFRLSTELLF